MRNVQALHMYGFVGKRAQDRDEGMNTENTENTTGYRKTLT